MVLNSQSLDQKINAKERHIIQERKHTTQNQNTINLEWIIIHKSKHSTGSHHDYSIYKSKHPVLSEQLLQFYDLGYLGIQKDFPNQISILPYKKKKSIILKLVHLTISRLKSRYVWNRG